MNTILVIEDRKEVRLSLAMLFEDEGYCCVEADNPHVAQMMLKEHDISLILLDMNFATDTTSGREGLTFLTWLQNSDFKHITVVAMTAWSNTELVVESMKLGAKDFVEKPWRNQQLLHVIKQQLDLTQLQNQNSQLKQQISAPEHNSYQWRSKCMTALEKKINAVAHTDVSVLLTGDNGTGKSELARMIHQQSTRNHEPFVAVNMGAISENLFESEMFGHKKGAFTDAKQARVGRFELAQSGTLFLDEIANIPLSQQAKMLRVLENGEYEQLGSSKTKTTNTRVISATNGDFDALIKSGEFREDLYYRLNTIELHVPALKERQDDIIPLAEFFVHKFSARYKVDVKSFSVDALDALLSYHWPGNVREMSHLIERAVLLCEQSQISVMDLHLERTTKLKSSTSHQLPFMTLQEAEVSLIKQALAKTKNHIPQAAELLGLTKASMYRRLEKHNIEKDSVE